MQSNTDHLSFIIHIIHISITSTLPNTDLFNTKIYGKMKLLHNNKALVHCTAVRQQITLVLKL